ncbi:uncharacterized protein LOC106168425 [Lingula anatina]|uniref:Uncharacterized protein LOC106168425 n=1 Tax=Lingula anatina TaxID=7574 RepID=A0A1S3IXI8_LINAN|nr:uncharacterized protein LOC106168425 [Lingula anatina]|eukprot:XP_013402915.1 uncharacterized protein LOC106168425 [Lingula anatina]
MPSPKPLLLAPRLTRSRNYSYGPEPPTDEGANSRTAGRYKRDESTCSPYQYKGYGSGRYNLRHRGWRNARQNTIGGSSCSTSSSNARGRNSAGSNSEATPRENITPESPSNQQWTPRKDGHYLPQMKYLAGEVRNWKYWYELKSVKTEVRNTLPTKTVIEQERERDRIKEALRVAQMERMVVRRTRNTTPREQSDTVAVPHDNLTSEKQNTATSTRLAVLQRKPAPSKNELSSFGTFTLWSC